MATEERNILISLIGEVLVNLYFAYTVWQMFGAGLATASDGVQTWAQVVIWIIPVGIGTGIVLAILGRIFASLMGEDRGARVHLDERDRGIQIKGMAVTMVVAALAFIAALSALAYGAGALVGLNIIFFGFGTAAIAGDLAKLVMYRVFG